MLKNTKSDQKGFTIIEVLIVLAIAGLILIVVLLAVPALQRNSRNTAIKNDASAVAGGVNEFESNNDGAVPTGITGTGTVAVSGAAGTTATNAKVQGGTAVTSSATAPGSPLTSPGLGKIAAHIGFRCDNTPSARAVAVVYAIENSGAAAQVKCVES